MVKLHDASYKLLFSCPELVRDLVSGFIPDPWLQSLDYSTLERQNDSLITDDLRVRDNDVLWRVRVQGRWVYLYLLIEFQSRVDHFMAVRVMTYTGLVYQDLIRKKVISPCGLLPPILPIVLYNGPRRWNAPLGLSALIPEPPGVVALYRPALDYLLIDLAHYNPDKLRGVRNLVALIAQMEQVERNEAIIDLVQQLRDLAQDNPELERTLTTWVGALIKRNVGKDFDLPQNIDLKGVKMQLEKRFQQWFREHEQKGLMRGREEGREEGMAELLERALTKRFGPLPDNVKGKIHHASAAQLANWFDRALDVQRLDDVFMPDVH